MEIPDVIDEVKIGPFDVKQTSNMVHRMPELHK